MYSDETKRKYYLRFRLFLYRFMSNRYYFYKILKTILSGPGGDINIVFFFLFSVLNKIQSEYNRKTTAVVIIMTGWKNKNYFNEKTYYIW